ncbi:MAG: hypothetical protein JNK57_15615 [Planctomycetaceae bacterium]|nr:hypothetical protein [Planctomycetaceae bacterium]
MATIGGGIHSDSMYTTNDLRKLGIGTTMLGRARRDGVTAVRIGKSDWFYGADVIAWMRSKAGQAKPQDNADGNWVTE